MTEHEQDQLESRVRVLRIVVTAIAGGLLAFLCLTVILLERGTLTPHDGPRDLLLLALGLLALGELPVYLVIRRALIGNLRRSWARRAPQDAATPPLATGYATITIIGVAMVEGLGLFGTVISMVTGDMAVLIVPLIALLLLAALFPTYDKARRFAAAVTG